MKKYLIVAFATLSFFAAHAQQGLQMGNRFMNQNYLLMNGTVTYLDKQDIIDWAIMNGFRLPYQKTDPNVLILGNLHTGQVTFFLRQSNGSWKC